MHARLLELGLQLAVAFPSTEGDTEDGDTDGVHTAFAASVW